MTGFGLVTFNTTESLTYNGQGGNDLLTFSVPVGTTTYTPGATPDAATVQVDSLVPIAFAESRQRRTDRADSRPVPVRP